MKKRNLCFLLPVLGCFIAFYYAGVSRSTEETVVNIACYIVLILLAEILIKFVQCTEIFSFTTMDAEDFKSMLRLFNFNNMTIFAAICSLTTLTFYGNWKTLMECAHLVPAYCLLRYLNYDEYKYNDELNPMIDYGAGIAYNFFEGYLNLVLPNDGTQWFGFREVINIYECKHNIVFPKRKLFIIITKSLHCPPDLKDFNKDDPSLPYLEACESLEKHKRDIAGCKQRQYKNTAYKIHQQGQKPKYIVAECATPLLTLYKIRNKSGYYPALKNVNFEQVTKNFCKSLQEILELSHETRGLCEIVHYNDEDPNENLAEILLEKIGEKKS